MLTLEQRHADRVKRVAENLAEGGKPSNSAVQAAIGHASNFVEALTGLSMDERQHVMKSAEDGFRSLADGPVTSDMSKYAGIGIANPLIVPLSEMPAAPDMSLIEDTKAGNGGWGAGNANGRAVAAQAGDSANDGKPVESEADVAAREQAAAVAAAAKGTGTTTTIPAA